MNRWLLRLPFFFLGATAAIHFAAGQERMGASNLGSRQALVIGNAEYPDDEVPLRHPVKDARALADELRRSGFEVEIGANLTKQAMQAGIDRFKARIKPGSAALIYFGGHGIQVARHSHMIPVNAQIWSEADVRRDGISIESVLADMDSRGATIKLVIIDASRVNPFERRFRGFSAGIASINTSPGTLVVYAAGPGMKSIDGDGENSLFIVELLKEIRAPGTTAEEVFVRTRLGVSRASNGKQVPWVSSSLTEDFYFGRQTLAARPPAGPTESRPAEPPPTEPPPSEPLRTEPAPTPKPQADDPDAETRRDCALAEQKNTKKAWEDFLAKYPTGPCADAAREQLAKLHSAPPAKPPLGDRPADDHAIREFNDAIARNPDDAEAYYKRGQAYAKRRDYERAIRDFDQAIRLNPNDPEAFNDRCWTRAIIGQLRAALADCNKSLALQPDFADAFDSVAFIYLKMGDTRRAITFYDAALRGNPEQPSALFGRGKAKLKKGDTVGGNADVNAAKAIKPDIAEEFADYGVR